MMTMRKTNNCTTPLLGSCATQTCLIYHAVSYGRYGVRRAAAAVHAAGVARVFWIQAGSERLPDFINSGVAPLLEHLHSGTGADAAKLLTSLQERYNVDHVISATGHCGDGPVSWEPSCAGCSA